MHLCLFVRRKRERRRTAHSGIFSSAVGLPLCQLGFFPWACSTVVGFGSDDEPNPVEASFCILILVIKAGLFPALI